MTLHCTSGAETLSLSPRLAPDLGNVLHFFDSQVLQLKNGDNMPTRAVRELR